MLVTPILGTIFDSDPFVEDSSVIKVRSNLITGTVLRFVVQPPNLLVAVLS